MFSFVLVTTWKPSHYKKNIRSVVFSLSSVFKRFLTMENLSEIQYEFVLEQSHVQNII